MKVVHGPYHVRTVCSDCRWVKPLQPIYNNHSVCPDCGNVTRRRTGRFVSDEITVSRFFGLFKSTKLVNTRFVKK